MKKLLASTLALVLLCGCGGSKPAENTKTCSIDQGGATMEVTATASDGTNVSKVGAKMIIPEESLSDMGYGETIEDAEASLGILNTMMDSMEDEGLEIEVKIDGSSMVIDFAIDLEKVSSDTLEALGITDITEAGTLDEFVKNATESGATCK